MENNLDELDVREPFALRRECTRCGGGYCAWTYDDDMIVTGTWWPRSQHPEAQRYNVTNDMIVEQSICTSHNIARKMIYTC